MLYGKTGRPNFSVARLLGLCLLQELSNLSDQQALDAFSFDIRWRYALDVGEEEDYLVPIRKPLISIADAAQSWDKITITHQLVPSWIVNSRQDPALGQLRTQLPRRA